jgi:hypothetical protein
VPRPAIAVPAAEVNVVRPAAGPVDRAAYRAHRDLTLGRKIARPMPDLTEILTEDR